MLLSYRPSVSNVVYRCMTPVLKRDRICHATVTQATCCAHGCHAVVSLACSSQTLTCLNIFDVSRGHRGTGYSDVRREGRVAWRGMWYTGRDPMGGLGIWCTARRRPLLPAPPAGGQVAVPIVAPAVAPVVAQNFPPVVDQNVPPVVAPVGVPAMAAAELAAFVAELGNEVMGDYNNVFLRDGVAANAEDYDENDSEDDEDKEEEAMDDDEEDWSDDEFDDAEFANV